MLDVPKRVRERIVYCGDRLWLLGFVFGKFLQLVERVSGVFCALRAYEINTRNLANGSLVYGIVLFE